MVCERNQWNCDSRLYVKLEQFYLLKLNHIITQSVVLGSPKTVWASAFQPFVDIAAQTIAFLDQGYSLKVGAYTLHIVVPCLISGTMQSQVLLEGEPQAISREYLSALSG